MTETVYIPKSFPVKSIETLEKAGYNIIFQSIPTTPEVILKEAVNAQAIIAGTDTYSKDIFDNLPNLKIIARNGVGVDAIDVDAATNDGIWVTNTPGANSTSMAEGTVLMILAVMHNLYNMSQKMHDNDWMYGTKHAGHELHGKTVGIIGLGNIGRQTFDILKGFGVDLLVYNPSDKHLPNGVQVPLDDLLAKSDVVVLSIASTPDTFHLLDETAINKMKNQAVVINLGRGALIDTEALITNLKNGKLLAAGLDTFEQEPLPSDSPLYTMDNVTLTPHSLGLTQEAQQNMANISVENVMAVLKGNNPINPVNNISN